MSRLFDIILSGVALVILSPLLVPLFVILRLTGEGEVFYRQLRVGFRGERFNIYKFSTMLRDSANIGAGTLTMINDPRVLPVGAFLRKTKINELPQLLNIFIGDMSFVGPRPEVRKYVDFYTLQHLKVLTVKPGITDLASIEFRNENEILSKESNPEKYYIETIMPYKIELNLKYIKSRSLLKDIEVIFKTFKILI